MPALGPDTAEKGRRTMSEVSLRLRTPFQRTIFPSEIMLPLIIVAMKMSLLSQKNNNMVRMFYVLI